MNKIIIPLIVAVTVLIVGVFALIPVEKASTVHDQIIAQTGITTASATSTVEDADIVITCGTAGDGCVIWNVYVDDDDLDGSDDVVLDQSCCPSSGITMSGILGETFPNDTGNPCQGTIDDVPKVIWGEDCNDITGLPPGSTMTFHLVEEESESDNYTVIVVGIGDLSVGFS